MTYFYSYRFLATDGATGVGNGRFECHRDRPPTFDDIEEVQRKVKEASRHNAVVIVNIVPISYSPIKPEHS